MVLSGGFKKLTWLFPRFVGASSRKQQMHIHDYVIGLFAVSARRLEYCSKILMSEAIFSCCWL